MKFPENLKKYREEVGLKKAEFARKLGIPYTTYNNYENGTGEPRLDLLIQIARFLSVSVDDLLGVNETDDFSMCKNILQDIGFEVTEENQDSIIIKRKQNVSFSAGIERSILLISLINKEYKTHFDFENIGIALPKDLFIDIVKRISTTVNKDFLLEKQQTMSDYMAIFYIDAAFSIITDRLKKTNNGKLLAEQINLAGDLIRHEISLIPDKNESMKKILQKIRTQYSSEYPFSPFTHTKSPKEIEKN